MKLSERLKANVPYEIGLHEEVISLEVDRELLEGFLDIWSSNSELNLKECRLAMEKEVKDFKEIFEVDTNKLFTDNE